MAKKDRSINPAEAHRKAQRKKEVKKNKEERKKARDSVLLKRDPRSVAAEIEKLQELDEEGQLDSTGKSKLTRLIAGKSKIEEFRKNNKPIRTTGPVVPDAKVVIPKDPKRSYYYHPTLNPLGVPPPGMPYREIELSDDEKQEEKESEKEEQDEEDSDLSSLSDNSEEDIETNENIIIESTENEKDLKNVENKQPDSNLSYYKEFLLRDDNKESSIPFPNEEPPSSAISKIKDISYLPPLPKGPPPNYALMKEVDLTKLIGKKVEKQNTKSETTNSKKASIQKHKSYPEKKKQVNKPLNMAPLPFPLHAYNAPGGYYAPPQVNASNYYRPPFPYHGDIQPPHSFQQAPQYYENNQSDANKADLNVAQIHKEGNGHKRMLKTNKKVNDDRQNNEAKASNSTVISAEPVLRDLQKEAIAFVPAAIRKKLKVEKSEGNLFEMENQSAPKVEPAFNISSHGNSSNFTQQSQGIRLYKPVINTAPELDPVPSKNKIKTNVVKPTGFKPPPPKSFMGLPPKSASKEKTEGKTTSKDKDDDYERFMKEMEGLL